MVLCPVAIAVGCKKCPVFGICPVKGIIGDYKKEDDVPSNEAPSAKKSQGKSARKGRG
jgi:hypothetical protein